MTPMTQHKMFCDKNIYNVNISSTRPTLAVTNKPQILRTHFRSYRQANIEHCSLPQTTFINYHTHQAILDKRL